MVFTPPLVWSDGGVPTVAQFNAQLKANQEALTEWQDYTPTWTGASSNPAIGSGTLAGRYCVAGDIVHVRIHINCAADTTFGSGTYFFGLPEPMADDSWSLPAFFIKVVGVNLYWPAIARWDGVDGSTVRIRVGTGALSYASPTVPDTWAQDTELWVCGWYRTIEGGDLDGGDATASATRTIDGGDATTSSWDEFWDGGEAA